jgi:hypothetical protein
MVSLLFSPAAKRREIIWTFFRRFAAGGVLGGVFFSQQTKKALVSCFTRDEDPLVSAVPLFLEPPDGDCPLTASPALALQRAPMVTAGKPGHTYWRGGKAVSRAFSADCSRESANQNHAPPFTNRRFSVPRHDGSRTLSMHLLCCYYHTESGMICQASHFDFVIKGNSYPRLLLYFVVHPQFYSINAFYCCNPARLRL